MPLFSRLFVAKGGNPGKDANVDGGVRVLVVDELTDTADVLRAVLEPRGYAVEQAYPPAGQSVQATRSERPARFSLMVVDAETVAHRGDNPAHWAAMPKVVIGRMLLSASQSAALDEAPQRALRKPFQYAELLQAIESLVAEGA